MATTAPTTHTRARAHARTHPTCRRQAVRARFSSSIHRIHPPSSSRFSSASLLLLSLPPPLCTVGRSAPRASSLPTRPSLSVYIRAARSRLPGRAFGRTDVLPSSRYRSLLHPPRLSLDSPPPPPPLLLLFSRYRDPARRRITSRHRYSSQIPWPPVALSLAPVPLSRCRSRRRRLGRSVCSSTQAHRAQRGAVHEGCSCCTDYHTTPASSLLHVTVTVNVRIIIYLSSAELSLLYSAILHTVPITKTHIT